MTVPTYCAVVGLKLYKTNLNRDPILTIIYTPFTRSSKHRANVEQMYSKYTC